MAKKVVIDAGHPNKIKPGIKDIVVANYDLHKKIKQNFLKKNFLYIL